MRILTKPLLITLLAFALPAMGCSKAESTTEDDGDEKPRKAKKSKAKAKGVKGAGSNQITKTQKKIAKLSASSVRSRLNKRYKHRQFRVTKDEKVGKIGRLLGWDPIAWDSEKRFRGFVRVSGTLGNPNFLSAYLAAALPIGLFLAVETHGRKANSLESWAWLALIVVVAAAFQFLAVLTKNEERRIWAERTAAATAIALMVPASAVSSADRSASAASIATILVLGILAILSSTRSRSGEWYMAVTAATALWQTVVYFDIHQHSSGSASGSGLIITKPAQVPT